MTSDFNAMPAASMGTSDMGENMPNMWPSGGSTSSMAMDNNSNDGEDDDGNDNNGDADSGGGGSRKYERKTRRFAWPDELHRLFVAAIFDLGLKNASPKALLPFMEPTATNAGLTTEHLKSHLQKYRLNYDKSRGEFLAFFDDSAKRNGRRRRRTAKSTESHTRFIFPIAPSVQAQSQSGESPPDAPITDGVPATSQLQINTAVIGRSDGSAPPLPYAAMPFSSLTPRSRLKRAQLLRLAQHNAALAMASQSAMSAYTSGYSPRDGTPGVDGVTDAQWGMLASLLSPQLNDGGGASSPAPFSLSDEPSPDMQMQMHLAMQAQMNLHRQMLTRKVAVSQNYYSQAAAVKRAAASAMVERALQNHQQQQQQPLQSPPSGRYNAMAVGAPPSSSRSSMGEGGMLQPTPHHHHQQVLLQQQQPPQRYMTSSQADALLGPPWDPMDIDMNEDQSDLFGFLKSAE